MSKQFKGVLNKYISGFWWERTKGDWLLLELFGFKWELIHLNRFVSYKQFSSLGINWWTGVVWIVVMFFYQLFGLSFWRHPFTTKDPLLSKWCNAKFLQICSDEETNSSWMAWEWVTFQQTVIVGKLLF